MIVQVAAAEDVLAHARGLHRHLGRRRAQVLEHRAGERDGGFGFLEAGGVGAGLLQVGPFPQVARADQDPAARGQQPRAARSAGPVHRVGQGHHEVAGARHAG